jgi:uncharacterized membrane protein YbhN (UPF0104 family)
LARKWGPHIVGAVLLTAAAFELWDEFHNLAWAEMAARMRRWGAARVAIAGALSAASFALLGVVEWLGLRWSGRPLRWRTAMLRGFIVNGITHALGSSVVIATAARTWAYGHRGLTLAPSAMTSIFNAVSFATGLALMAGAGLMFADPAQLAVVRLSVLQGRLLAAVGLGAVALYVAGCLVWPAKWRLFDTPAPPLGYAIAQVVLGAIDNALSAAILWVLVGPDQAPFDTFVFAYALAVAVASISHVPGGLGVFEGTLSALMPTASPEALGAGFIGFRLIFYVAPLALAVAAALIDGAIRARRRSEATPPADSQNSVS